ncbi:unnamed protein product [Schistosoma turkestanicum]|nr:unnamed protein product [Schistosoma turkestanicum]
MVLQADTIIESKQNDVFWFLQLAITEAFRRRRLPTLLSIIKFTNLCRHFKMLSIIPDFYERHNAVNNHYLFGISRMSRMSLFHLSSQIIIID